MSIRKKIFVIVGSASVDSANEKLCHNIARLLGHEFDFTSLGSLKTLPHFDPSLSTDNPPKKIVALRDNIQKAYGVLICTPEYIFSIPSGLKNALEWCVSTTAFSDKPVGLITASASGEKGHEELQLIMKTIMAKFTDETTLLIRGVKGKINQEGMITDNQTKSDVEKFAKALKSLIEDCCSAQPEKRLS